jgi:ribosome biogenesis GTPase
MADKKKIRVDFRKNRSKPPRDNRWTREFQEHGFAEEATQFGERVRAKGDLSRRRTIMQTDADGDENKTMPSADVGTALLGKVIRVHGLHSIVQVENGQTYRCAVRRLLKSLASSERSVVATGDDVWFRPSPVVGQSGQEQEGFIERVEPRHGVLTRESQGKEHVLVANVDQLVIVMSLVEPSLKPHLIDRYLAAAEQNQLSPIVCLNKADQVEPDSVQQLIGMYAQLGVPALLTSALSGVGVAELRERLRNRTSVFAGQSGVGKSSLLNAVQPGLGLRVREVSEVNQKGRHTTTTSILLHLDIGGWVVDTPGIRQLKLSRLRPEEVEGLLPEMRPIVAACSFPDCTHQHEEGCSVLKALQRRQISSHRYLSYLGMFRGDVSP